jgi:hypothetical protein
VRPLDRRSETIAGRCYRLVDGARRAGDRDGPNKTVLTATEKKTKGVAAALVTQEKEADPPAANQRWVLVRGQVTPGPGRWG